MANHWLIGFVAPQMIERKDGAIIIVSSIGGLRGSPVIGAYNISKAADFQLARNLAVEYGPHNVRVNCIAPGLIKTDFARALWEDPKMLEATHRHHAAAAHRRARRDRGRGDFSGVQGRIVRDRAGDRGGRRGDDLAMRFAPRLCSLRSAPASPFQGRRLRTGKAGSIAPAGAWWKAAHWLA